MELVGKELCGKNIYFVKRTNRLSMYHHEKKVGEITLNENGNVIGTSVYEKQYLKNMIYYININKNLIIDDIKGFPCNYKDLNKIKERLHPDTLFRCAIIASSVKLAEYALEREAFLTKETFISSAIHSASILAIHLRTINDHIEEAMEAAFINKNYDSIKMLAKRTNNLEKYINMCNQEEKYQVIKKILINALVQRNSNAK